MTLRHTLRTAADGLPQVSTAIIRAVLRDASWTWQRTRSWYDTGKVVRRRKSGPVEVSDPDAEAKRLIERAYRQAPQLGLMLECEDEAGPFTTTPYDGASWEPQSQPARQGHEYLPDGTAKLLTLLHPMTGHVRAKGVSSSTNGAACVAEGGAGGHSEHTPSYRYDAPRGTPGALGDLAGRADNPADLAGGAATVADAADLGQPGRAQNARAGPVAVSSWYHAVVYTTWRVMVKYGRVDSAHSEAARLELPPSRDTSRDYRLAGGDRPRLESHPDLLYLGRQAGRAP